MMPAAFIVCVKEITGSVYFTPVGVTIFELVNVSVNIQIRCISNLKSQ
jgi:hypothetical protein